MFERPKFIRVLLEIRTAEMQRALSKEEQLSESVSRLQEHYETASDEEIKIEYENRQRILLLEKTYPDIGNRVENTLQRVLLINNRANNTDLEVIETIRFLTQLQLALSPADNAGKGDPFSYLDQHIATDWQERLKTIETVVSPRLWKKWRV